MKNAIIKPLVWELSNAQSIVGTYSIGRTGGEWWVRLRDCEIAEGHAETFEAAEIVAQAAAQAHYTARILSALHPASPLGAVAMREKAAKFCTDNEVGVSPIRGYVLGPFEQGEHSGTHPGMAYSPAIRTLPTTFTDAELIASAAEVILQHVLSEPKEDKEDPMIAGAVIPWLQDLSALAPFARKGGQ